MESEGEKSWTPIDEKTVSFAVSLLHALAHPTRFRIVEALSQKPRTASNIAQFLGLHQPNTSQHLAILSRAGIITVTQEGVSRCYALHGPNAERILELIQEFQPVSSEE